MERAWYRSYAQRIQKTLTYKNITVGEALRRSAREYPNHPALIFLDSPISFRQLDQMADRFACALLDLGVKPGDRVAMLMPNMPQLVVATHGAWRAGAVVVMNNPLYTDAELEHQFKDSESSILVTLDLWGSRMIALRPRTPVKKIVVAHLRDHLKFPPKQLFPILAKDKHRRIPSQENVYE